MMKKINRRRIAWMLLLPLLFTGCSNTSKEPADPQEVSAEASVETSQNEMSSSAGEEDAAASAADEAAEAYEKKLEEAQLRRNEIYQNVDISKLDGSGGSPWIDSDLKENIPSAAPKAVDDFHLYANFDWLSAYGIPRGYQSVSPFGTVQTQTTKRAQELLNDTSQKGHDIELCQSLYHAILDWDTRNALGMEPVRPVIEDIESISSIRELNAFICDPERSYRVPTFLFVYNQVNLEDSGHYITSIAHDPFTLDDAAEYKNRSDIGTLYYEAQKQTAEALMTRLGYSKEEVDEKYDAMISFEGKLAEVSLTRDEKLAPDIYKEYLNYYKPAEIKKLSSNFPLSEFILSQGYGNAERFMIYEPKELARLNEIYTEENLESMKAAMEIGYLFSMCEMLDKQAYNALTALNNMVSGTTGSQTDTKIAFDTVRACLTVPMDRAYLEKYDAKDLKAKITAICKEEIAAYRKMLEGETWLSEETRKAAIEKLDNIAIHAVYPDKWENFDGLELKGKNYVECMQAIEKFAQELDHSHTNGTVDRDLWRYDILEANSYYSQQENSINILYGILGDVFYSEDMTKEQLYGGIGAIIGHEISHAFDTKGGGFDKDGNYKNWWAAEDYTAFLERADRVVDYFDNIMVMEGVPVNGANIQTEAIADMAGLKVLLLIAAEKEGFDYDTFFRQYSHVWRRMDILESEYMLITQDTHPMGYLRTNVSCQQFDEFYNTYGIKPGDGMYLDPSERIGVW